MPEIVRILLLEDTVSDAQLAEREIRKVLKNSEVKQVETKEEFTQALINFDPELIISDYNLPSFNGLEALKIKQEIKPEIPLIIFTGSINEDTAVACMKAGAIDYVIKEFIKRLGPAVIYALEQRKNLLAKRKAEQELIQSEERFHRLADNMPDMLYRIKLNPFRSFEYVNPVTEKITGYSVGELCSNPELGIKIIHPEDFIQLDEKINSGDYFYKPVTIRLIRKDQSIIWLEQRNIPIFDETGKIVAVEGIAQDITEKRNSEILKQAIFSMAQAANSTKNLNELYAVVHNTISTIMPANNFYIALLNSKTNEISFPYFVDEKDSPPQKRKYGEGFTEFVITTGKPLLSNLENSKKLNAQFNIVQEGLLPSIWLGVPLKFEGTTIGVMAVHHYHDETAYGEKEKNMLEYVSTQVAKTIVFKQAEEQILKLSKVVEQSPVNILITNTNSEIEYVNPAFTQSTGYSLEEVLGKKPNILKSGKTPTEVYVELWKTILSGKVWNGELINRKKNGELFVENANIFPVIDENGKFIFYIAIKEDITKKKIIEQELIDAKEKAEESDNLKSAFLHNLSHEIRTPMNAIAGFSELLELEIDDPDKSKYFSQVIRQRSNDLLDIINELLDIAKIETGQLNFKTEKVDLNRLFHEMYSFFSEHKLQLDKPSIRLVFKYLPNNISPIITTDAGKLKQIFINLIHNAFKFTNQGKIEFGFHAASNHSITFFVSDTGMGIPENMKDIVFKRFRKSDDEAKYVQDGLGLGLSIVKGLLDLFEGKIWFESEVDKGTNFYFTIPYQLISETSESQKSLPKQKYDWAEYTLLIVEDDSYNVAFLVELLSSTNIKYLVGYNGKEAISIFTGNQNINIVLMDIKLPDMNGFEVTKIFKKIHPEIPIIAQTAYAAETDKNRALEAGCDDFCAKPINRHNFLELLNKYLTAQKPNNQ